MTTINLYRYEDPNGITITPDKRNPADTPHCYRLIADEGKLITSDGINKYSCIDISDPTSWYEV